ncbi:EamA domain [Dillenia turbinata]|uniref:WAT1-related protein n=1 Tax=Dillenia turbinata TaxID=194707 RepID=A0AAN8W8A9_9MAGN
MKSSDKCKPVAAMITIDFALAIVNILLKTVLDKGMNHLVLITYRLAISAIFLAPIAYLLERNSRPKLTTSILCHLFFSAVVGASLTQYCFLIGIEYTSATFACAFINLVPVFTFVMALPFRLETVNIKSNSGRAKVLGTLVCVSGAMLLSLYKGTPLFNSSISQVTTAASNHTLELTAAKRTERWTIGSIALVAGTFFWSSWFLLQSKIIRRYPCQYSSTAIMSSFGAIQSAILSLSIDRNLSSWILKGKVEILTVVYSGIVGSGLCYVGMSWSVKKKGPVFTAAFSPLIQILGAMFEIPPNGFNCCNYWTVHSFVGEEQRCTELRDSARPRRTDQGPRATIACHQGQLRSAMSLES